MTDRALLACGAVAAALLILAQSGEARAQDTAAPPARPASTNLAPRRSPLTVDASERFVWRYPEFRTSEYVVTGIFGALAIGGLLIPSDTPRWTGTNGLDEGARNALRLESRDARKTADDISDVTLVLSLNYLAFDAGVVAWWARGKGSVGFQVAAVDVETIAIAAGLGSVVKGAVARQRPYARECTESALVARTDDCETDALNRSFYSGHTTTTFAAAGLTCMHHANLALYDDPVADAAACVAAFGMAGATGVLRVMSDNHYVTDVATGAAVGTAVGLGVPWLLHYQTDLLPTATSTGGVTVTFVPGPTSGTFLGTFQ